MKTKITWLGQAGLLFETDGKTIIVDPYLSDSVEKINSKNYRRKPVDKKFLEIKPDIIVLTHDHLDHTDPDTLCSYLTENSGVLVLAGEKAWERARKFGGNNNYVMFTRHTLWTEGNLTFEAVKAVHSDNTAIGVIIDDGERKYYITGDTLYNKEIFSDLPEDIYAVFLPVNGVGNNMNMKDAEKFGRNTKAKKIVPLHFGLFDDIVPEGFEIIPEIYKEINV